MFLSSSLVNELPGVRSFVRVSPQSVPVRIRTGDRPLRSPEILTTELGRVIVLVLWCVVDLCCFVRAVLLCIFVLDSDNLCNASNSMNGCEGAHPSEVRPPPDMVEAVKCKQRQDEILPVVS